MLKKMKILTTHSKIYYLMVHMVGSVGGAPELSDVIKHSQTR